jgi:glycosyltransferase involved in cell wall biosynthesis
LPELNEDLVLKVVFFANDSNHTYKWLEAALREGFETVWVRPSPIRKIRYRLSNSSDLTVYDFSSRIIPLNYVRTLIEAGPIVRQENPSLIHAHYLWHNGLIASLCKGNTPLVVSVWGSDLKPFIRLLGSLGLSRKVFKRFDLVTTCGAHLRDRLLRIGLVNEHNCVNLPFGVNTEVFKPGSVPLDKRDFDIISTRTHNPIYRVDTLLHALYILRKKHNIKPRTLVVGTGSQTQSLKKLCYESGLNDQVRFEGLVEPFLMPALLSRARIYVSCSSEDGASTSLLEAMSCGLIPVVTEIRANQAWVDDKSGILFPVADPVILAETLGATIGRIKDYYNLAIRLHDETS